MEKVVTISNLKDNKNDFAYWQTKSPAERLEALEILRQQYLELNKDVHQGLQRVYKIVNRKSS